MIVHFLYNFFVVEIIFRFLWNRFLIFLHLLVYSPLDIREVFFKFLVFIFVCGIVVDVGPPLVTFSDVYAVVEASFCVGLIYTLLHCEAMRFTFMPSLDL